MNQERISDLAWQVRKAAGHLGDAADAGDARRALVAYAALMREVAALEGEWAHAIA